MPSANSRKKFIWMSRIFTAVGVIVGLAGIGCLGVGLAFTLTGIGAGLGIPLMLGGLVGVGVGAMTTSLSLISLWRGKKEENLTTAKQASSDKVSADVSAISTSSSSQESHSNSKLSRLFSSIRAFFSRATTKKEVAKSVAQFESSSKHVAGTYATIAASTKDASAPRDNIYQVGAALQAEPPIYTLSPEEKVLDALSLFAADKPGCEFLERKDRLNLRAANRGLRDVFTKEIQSEIKVKKDGLYCYCTDRVLDLTKTTAISLSSVKDIIKQNKSLNYSYYIVKERVKCRRKDQILFSILDDDVVVAKVYGLDEFTIPKNDPIYNIVITANECKQRSNPQKSVEGDFSQEEIRKLSESTLLDGIAYRQNGVINLSNKPQKGSLNAFFYYDGIPAGFFMRNHFYACIHNRTIISGHENKNIIIYLNNNMSCKVLNQMFSEMRDINFFPDGCDIYLATSLPDINSLRQAKTPAYILIKNETFSFDKQAIVKTVNNKVYYFDGQSITQIEIEQEDIVELQNRLKINEVDMMGKHHKLSEDQLDIITSISKHISYKFRVFVGNCERDEKRGLFFADSYLCGSAGNHLQGMWRLNFNVCDFVAFCFELRSKLSILYTFRQYVSFNVLSMFSICNTIKILKELLEKPLITDKNIIEIHDQLEILCHHQHGDENIKALFDNALTKYNSIIKDKDIHTVKYVCPPSLSYGDTHLAATFCR